jgi:polar amino acid transport system substrate-binding protein
MRQITVAAVAAITALTASVGLAACGSSSSSSAGSGTASTASATASAASCSNASIQSELFAKGTLTVATDKPAYPPWFENNQPSNGQGYESAVAYAVAAQLGFAKSGVTWAYEPFNDSYAPGPKKFDFDINEISYSAARAQVVTFSDSYYDVQQSLVALKGSPIVSQHTAAELKNYVYGDQVGTTSLAFINSEIQPTKTPKVFESLNDVKQALQDKQIAALVTDTPTAQYISSSEISGSVMVAQFPSTGEHYGLLFAKGNPLVSCVNKALTTLRGNGTLAKLQAKYLQIYTSVPTIKP